MYEFYTLSLSHTIVEVINQKDRRPESSLSEWSHDSKSIDKTTARQSTPDTSLVNPLYFC